MVTNLHDSYENFLGMLDAGKKRWFTDPVHFKNRRPGFYQS